MTANEVEKKNIGLPKRKMSNLALPGGLELRSQTPKQKFLQSRVEANGRGFESNTQKNRLTFLLHVDLEALLEPARLALVAAGDVHHAVPVLLAHVVQVPDVRDKVQDVNF